MIDKHYLVKMMTDLYMYIGTRRLNLTKLLDHYEQQLKHVQIEIRLRRLPMQRCVLQSFCCCTTPRQPLPPF